MATEFISEIEETTSFGDDETEMQIVLKTSPLLSFASGPAPGIPTDGRNLPELQRPLNFERITHSGRHNCKQTNTPDADGNETGSKHDAKSYLGRAKDGKLDECSKRNANGETPLSPKSSPRSRKRHKMALMRSLSSSAAVPEEGPQGDRRRLSDPTVNYQKNLLKSAFDPQASFKKLRPYLKRKAVSPLHLLGKVTSTGHKNSNDSVGDFKEPKGSNKARFAKKLYPPFSNKAVEQVAQVERRGSDPSCTPTERNMYGSTNVYETVINDFSNQMQDLAVNLENLSAGVHTASQELPEIVSNDKLIRQQCGETESRADKSSGNFLKDADIHLKEMLEEVLKSHLLTMGDYSPPNCDRACKSICRIITRLLGGSVEQSADGQRKVACVVYIGAVRDLGVQMAAQALWCPEEDTFAAASFRNGSVCGMAVVIATPT